jgi:peptidoglycan/LPS O-acetylase OafA/YrhL
MGTFRLLLAICVLLQHSGAPFWGVSWLSGEGAVYVFFMISGFYMQMVLSDKYTQARLGDYWWARFYLARYFRLFPTYIVCVVATILAAAYASSENQRMYPPLSGWMALGELNLSLSNILLYGWVAISNIFIFFQEFAQVVAVQSGDAVLTLSGGQNYQSEVPIVHMIALPHGWTLGVELLFYMLAPFLMRLSDRTLKALVIVFLIVKLAPIYVLSAEFQHLHGRLAPFQFVFFLVGVLVGRARLQFEYPSWLAFVMLGAVIFTLPMIADGIAQALAAVAIASFAIPVAYRATQNSRIDRFIGELSYAFYVFHVLCLAIASFVLQRVGIFEKGAALSLIAILLTLIVSAVITYLEKLYVEPWRNTLSSPDETKPLIEKSACRV